MNYDDILEELGELGPWQILHLLLLWLPVCASGVWTLTYSITGKYVKYFTAHIFVSLKNTTNIVIYVISMTIIFI